MNLMWKLALLPTWSQPTPSPDEARQQAHHELSKVAYKPKQNLLEKLFKWLDSTLSKAKLNLGLPEWVGVLLTFLIFVALIALLLYLATKITLARRKRKSKALFDDKRDASMLTLSANKAAAAGDWVSAVVDRFRAIIRSLDERALLEDYPGMTSQEAGQLGAQVMPNLSESFAYAANLFDRARYGHEETGPSDDQWMRDFAVTVTNTSGVTHQSAHNLTPELTHGSAGPLDVNPYASNPYATKGRRR